MEQGLERSVVDLQSDGQGRDRQRGAAGLPEESWVYARP